MTSIKPHETKHGKKWRVQYRDPAENFQDEAGHCSQD